MPFHGVNEKVMRLMGKKERSFAPLIHVSLEELVPQDIHVAQWQKCWCASFLFDEL